MKNRNPKRMIQIIVLLVCLVLPMILQETKLKAASASLNLEQVSETVKSGKKFSVSFTITATTGIGEVEVYMSYDDTAIEFLGGGSKIKGHDGIIYLSDAEFEANETKRKYVMEFMALKDGVTEIAVDEGALLYDYNNGSALSFAKKNVKIDVGGKVIDQASTYLKTLAIEGVEINPQFSRTTYDYVATMEYTEEKQVNVVAKPEEESSKVQIDGADQIIAGENLIKVTVSDNDGNQKVYEILLTMLELGDAMETPEPSGDPIDPTLQPTEEPSESEEPTATNAPGDAQELSVGLLNHILNGENLHSLKEGSVYQVVPVENEAIIPKGYEEATIDLGNDSVQAFVLTTANTLDRVLLYLKTENTEADFYQYDALEDTLQRYVAPKEDELYAISKIEFAQREKEYKDKIDILGIFLMVLTGVSVLLLGTTTRVIYVSKQKSRRKK